MSNSGKKRTDDDEVEQLLRAAQDDMLLKLSVNSHMARASASAAIDSDLDRRFQALKKPQKPIKIDDSMRTAPTKMETCDNRADGVATEDDLFARFAALKNTLPPYSGKANQSNFTCDESVNQIVREEDEGDEVEKVIKWAIDAARLDPSPPSDDDDDDADDDHDSDGDGDADGVDKAKKGKSK